MGSRHLLQRGSGTPESIFILEILGKFQPSKSRSPLLLHERQYNGVGKAWVSEAKTPEFKSFHLLARIWSLVQAWEGGGDVSVAGWIMVPKDFQVPILEILGVLPYMEDRSVQIWLNSESPDGEIILGYLGGPSMQSQVSPLVWHRDEEGNVIIMEAEGDLKRLHYWLWRWGKGPWAKEPRDCWKPPEVRKCREMNPLLEPLKGAWPWWHLNVSPVKLVLAFWSPQL